VVGELGCHSEDTLVLTPDGIKHWKEINVGDYVYGIDNKLRIVKTKVHRINIYPYKGKMIHFYSKHYDFLVTPNHRMIVSKDGNSFEYVRADEVVKNSEHLLPYKTDESVIFDKFDYEIVDYDGIVWSLTTDTGNYFTVRNGKVQVSGNSGKTLSAVYLVVRNYNKFKKEAEQNKQRLEEIKKQLELYRKYLREDPDGFKEYILRKLAEEKLNFVMYPSIAAEYEVLENRVKEEGPEAYIDYLEQQKKYLEFSFKPRRVYSNIMLYDIEFYKLNTISEFNWARNGIVLLDEIWSVGLDSRLSRRKKSIITANILGKSRKRGLTVLFTAQTMSQLDRRIREVLDFIAYPVMNSDGSICRLFIWRGNKPAGKPLKVLRFYTEEYYKYYNSREEVPELIDDTDENGLSEKEPELMFVPSSQNPAWIEYQLSKKYGFRRVI